MALAVGGAVFGIATAVQASIPDANGVIHGCYNISRAHGTPTGQLRVIDTAKIDGHCASWEAPLDWNQTGPTGPTGATGPTGPTGPSGVTGLAITTIVPFSLIGPTGLEAEIGCADSSKIAIGASLVDNTDAQHIVIDGGGNTGSLGGGTPDSNWTLYANMTSTSTDTVQLQIECVNPPVGTSAPANRSTSSAEPRVRIVRHPLR